MNYANLIDDAKLKKTFIVATLASTVIGTFQAATALHDKIEEKREKRAKQGELDQKQNKALKDLKEKLKKLEEGEKNEAGGNGGNGGNDAHDGNDGRDNHRTGHRCRSRSRSRSRSWSRRRRRSREEWEHNMYFADSARRSQAMIERTYQDHLQRLGPAYAQGDVITENALQAQTIRLQQTVIGILQDAANAGHGLSRDDLDDLIDAQNAARDGSLQALNGQYDRIAYGRRTSNDFRKSPAEVATYQHEPARLTIEPANSVTRHSSTRLVREPAILALAPVEETSRRSSVMPPPPPPSVQRDFARPAQGPPQKPGSHPPSIRSSPARATSLAAVVEAKVTPKEVDRVLEHQERRSRAGLLPTQRRSSSLVTPKPKASHPERKVTSLVDGATPQLEKRAASLVAKSTATQVNGRSAAPLSRAPSKSESRRDSVLPVPTANDKKRSESRRNSVSPLPPATETTAKKSTSTSMIVEAPKTLTTVQKSSLKALPTAPYELFCSYSIDLQQSNSPLHTSFRPSGSHRCPACDVHIPVDTRDVWVLSTHFPGKENRHQLREYRMDSRFVVKCHSPEGGFACVLCDRFRDMDCLCRSVDSLVKHLGTAHTPDEFERDRDLVRITDGERLDVKSREMVLKMV